MTDFQTVANRVRELVAEADTVQRLGIEVLRSAGTEAELTIRARHDERILTVARGAGWWEEPSERLAEELARDLVADVLAPSATAKLGPPARRRTVPLPAGGRPG